ncbi:glycoside hydrolase family protein [Carnimonas bestiolae]|uniref:glycoside hydrolase family protein n=1 Tax=Carnimonas bestiolae TaxID=3402172 RepID=UPI003EDB8CF3
MTTTAQANERAQIINDEGAKNRLYRDSVGKMTIGVGRNVEDVGLRDDEINYMLDNDIAAATEDAKAFLGADAFDALDDDRQGVLINMSFNLGLPRLRGFKQFRAALLNHDYQRAADEMLDSAWAKQVKARATRLAARMRGRQ